VFLTRGLTGGYIIGEQWQKASPGTAKDGMFVRVNKELCIGLGNCVVIAPTVFRMNTSNIAVVTDPTSVANDKLWEAAESCTAEAIILEDDSGNMVFP
jgi:ferredoxin